MAKKRLHVVVWSMGVALGALMTSPTLAAAATSTTTTGAPSTATTAPSAVTALVAASAKAAGQQKSVHFVAKSSESGRTVSITASSATTAGTEQIVLRSNKNTGHVSGRFINKIVYYKGDTFGLEEYLGMPATLAPKYSGKWIFFSPATKDYAAIAKSFTLSSALSQVTISGPYTQAKASVDGHPATMLTGRNTASGKKGKAGSATLALASTGTPLPIRFSSKTTASKKTVTGTVDFSRWGLSVVPKQPQGAVAASSITSSS